MREYRILPSVTDTGVPEWILVRELASPWAYSSRIIARNTDRAVLERAIDHLTSQGKNAEQS